MTSLAAVMSKLASRGHALAAQPEQDMAERPVVLVEHPRPDHGRGVDARVLLEVQVVVEQRRDQVVGRGDRVEVAREVQVDVGGGDQDRAPSSRPAALHAEARAERRLTQRSAHRLTEALQRLDQPDGGGGLAFPGGRGVGGGDQDQLAVPARPLDGRGQDLRLVASEGQDVVVGHAELGSDRGDGAHRTSRARPT
jgi:hypothetical protein